MYYFSYILSSTCPVKTLKPQWVHLHKDNKLVTCLIYKFRKQMKYKKSKHPKRKWKLSFSLQGGPCFSIALSALTHFNFPRIASGGHKEITRVPQTLHTRWQSWSTTNFTKSAAAAKSLQSCLTLCDPIDGSPPGPSVHGIFQARVLEWGAIAFSSQSLNPFKKVNSEVTMPMGGIT